MAISWVDIENAIRSWVKRASGYADSNVIWGNQNGPQPSGDFITVSIGDVSALGTDSLESVTNLSNAPGEEIELTVKGLREFPVSIQAFDKDTAGAGSAREVLSKIQTALKLPTVRSDLTFAGLSPFDIGSIRNIVSVTHAGFEARSILEVRFYVVESVSENVGYIDSVSLVDLTGNDTIDT